MPTILINATNYRINNLGEVHAAKRPGPSRVPELHLGRVDRDGSRWLALPLGWDAPCKVATRKAAVEYLAEQHRLAGAAPDDRTPQVHRFDSTGEAYGASQCDDDIKDGDVLVVTSERVVGVLCKAWPVAVTEARGSFHTLKQGTEPVTWDTYEDGRYARSAAVAAAHAAPLERGNKTSLNDTTINHQESSAPMSNTTQHTQQNTRVVKTGDEWVVEHIESGEVVGEPHGKKAEATQARNALPKTAQTRMEQDGATLRSETNDNDNTTEGNDMTNSDAKVNGLPPKTAEAYQLFQQGQSVKEIAGAMGVSTARVYGHKRAIQEAGLSVPAGKRGGGTGTSTRTSGTQRRSGAARGRSAAATPAPREVTAESIAATLESTVTAQLDAVAGRMDAVRAQREQLVAEHEAALAALTAEERELEALLTKMEAVREAAAA